MDTEVSNSMGTALKITTKISGAIAVGGAHSAHPTGSASPEVTTCRVKATFPTFLKKSSLSAGNLIKVEWHPLVIYYIGVWCPKELLPCTRNRTLISGTRNQPKNWV